MWFAKTMPHLSWQLSDRQLSDRQQNHAGIKQWVNDFPSPNLLSPMTLDVLTDRWLASAYDAAYSANTAHIMPWHAVEAMFNGIGERLILGGVFCLYGPMKYLGVLEAQSNVEFDYRLRQQSPHQGIREFHGINRLANALMEDNLMQANNRLIVWQKN